MKVKGGSICIKYQCPDSVMTLSSSGQFDSIAWNRYYSTSNEYDKVSVSSGSSGRCAKKMTGHRMHVEGHKIS